MLAELAEKDVVRYAVDGDFKRAALFFRDNSFLEFEHSSRENRWARPSDQGTLADKICRSMRQFRLNAKHLQLFFDDGSEVEFFQDERST
jgi:hypothetical protein